MRVGQFSFGDARDVWCGVTTEKGVVVNLQEAGEAAGITLSQSSTDLFSDPLWEQKVTLAVEYATETETAFYDPSNLKRHAPVTDPQKVVCVGLNYREHVEEGENEMPDNPVLFSKFPTCVTDPEGTISWDPDLTERVDYEGEMVLVIGRKAREISPEEALDYVAGYTIGNDISARDLQHGDGQWVRGKSLDTFAPIGPEIKTADEIDDPHDLDIWTEVNGNRLQDSSTSNLIFGIDELVSFCSKAFTLNPGDLIFTGTPPGVGVYRDPPVLLHEGDSVTVGIEDLGTLTNTCEYR